MKIASTFIVLLMMASIFVASVSAETIQQGKIISIEKETPKGQELRIDISGNQIPVSNLYSGTSRKQVYEVGDEVLISHISQQGKTTYYIKEYVRSKSIGALLLLFVASVILISGKKGALSLLGMVGSFFIIFYYLLPSIVSGADPVTTSLVAVGLLVPITFYISHGFNKNTTIAVMSTLLSLTVVMVLSIIWIQWAKLTGFSSEEASFLDVIGKGSFDMRGVLMAGIIIGSLGILDDVTISQVSIVQELRRVGKNKNRNELFFHAMKIGQDHISSMVNTLILVYTGAALPLFLLFIQNPQPFHQVIQYEMISEEIIRSLIGSIGIVLSVPLATYIASLFVD